MISLEDIAAKNGMIASNGVLGILLRTEGATLNEKLHSSILQRLFGSGQEEDKNEVVAKKYTCWTCGAAYGVPEAREFLTHIKECCKDDSVSDMPGEMHEK